MQSAVSGLENEFAPGKVQARNVDCQGPEGREAVQQLGFQSHGIALRDRAGTVLFKQADHSVHIEDVRKAVASALK